MDSALKALQEKGFQILILLKGTKKSNCEKQLD